MTLKERMTEHVKSLTEEDRLIFLKKQISTTIKDFKTKEKSLNAEFNYKGCRAGLRGGKITSLAAKTTNDTKAYLSSLEYLKLIVKYL